ncbi:MAG: GNAT family N-acetyltransferase [Anaerolineae bacterium]|nr:GNAT family N-acetyltransferase [Anaerolineae bacterium]
MSDLAIRRAEIRDIDDIQRLYRQLDRHHAELLPEVFQPLQGDARGDEFVQLRIERDDAAYLLAELDGTVIGFVDVLRSTHPGYPMFRPREFAMIDNLVVDEAHRGQGIGKSLLQAAISWARDNGLKYVQTTVWDANARARDLYLGQGFTPVTVRLELEVDADPGPTTQIPGS